MERIQPKIRRIYIMRELKQTWTGHGKWNCLEAIRQANNWFHSNRPDKFYDTDYAMP